MICMKNYVGDGWITYPNEWYHQEYIYKSEYFVVSVGVNGVTGKKKIFTGINPGVIVKPTVAAVRSQLRLHRKLGNNTLPSEVLPYLGRWINAGKLVWLSDVDSDGMQDIALYHPIVTQWYLVYGSKKCRPVFTYTLLNNSVRRSKVLIQFEQKKLRDIIICTRVFNRVLLRICMTLILACESIRPIIH